MKSFLTKIKSIFTHNLPFEPEGLYKELPKSLDILSKEPIYLNVPFAEKDFAKSRGARWNPQKKSWYIPPGFNTQPFEKWLPKQETETDPNIKSTGFYILKTQRPCWKCDQQSPVICFLLPIGHRQKEYEDDEDDSEPLWIPADYETTLSYVNDIPASVIEIAKEIEPNYFHDFSNFCKTHYYMNHCKKCGAKFGDFFSHDEPGVAFSPTSKEHIKAMKLYWFDEYFEASAGGFTVGIPFLINGKNSMDN